uniref:Cadherin domain-containing protein n=1 Tax=Heterorhabditis bacteriophora TaxID=37862 RepID=A0A1I7X5F8_HETBA
MKNGGNNPTPRTSSIGTLQPVYVAEPLEVNEGASIPLQWKNVYVLPEHSRLNISNKDILFSIVEGPHHGQLTLNGQPCGAFNYDNLLTRSVIYTHDGSETTQDSLEFQLEINNRLVDFPWLETTTYTLKIRINAVNDAPELYEAKTGQVRVQVIEGRGVHLRISNKTITEFTQRQFINRVRWRSSFSGYYYYYSNRKHLSSNLSFSASVPDLPLYFSIVGLPDHGVVECSPDEGHFAVCSRFSQSQVPFITSIFHLVFKYFFA